MKKLIYIVVLCLPLFIGCKSVKSESGGVDNSAFLKFVGEPNSYSNGVEVKIDDKASFIAKVNKDKFRPSKEKVYSLTPGKHEMVVTNNGTIIIKQQIFISIQETKKIILP